MQQKNILVENNLHVLKLPIEQLRNLKSFVAEITSCWKWNRPGCPSEFFLFDLEINNNQRIQLNKEKMSLKIHTNDVDCILISCQHFFLIFEFFGLFWIHGELFVLESITNRLISSVNEANIVPQYTHQIHIFIKQ